MKYYCKECADTVFKLVPYEFKPKWSIDICDHCNTTSELLREVDYESKRQGRFPEELLLG